MVGKLSPPVLNFPMTQQLLVPSITLLRYKKNPKYFVVNVNEVHISLWLQATPYPEGLNC